MRYRLLWLLPALTATSVALAQAPATGANASHARTVSHPVWPELSADQREALAPLAADWDKFDPDRKQKWLQIAAKYPNMSPDGKRRFHERMPQLAKLTPEQRETTRENFKRAYSLPPDKRQAVTQRYQDLPEDRKRALAAQAHAKKPPAAVARRPATPLREASSVQPAR